MWIWLILGSYLLGAVPFGLLIGFSRGVDVRRHGSGNIGATNVGRIVGKKWGYLCLLLDVLKGLVPALSASFLLIGDRLDPTVLLQWISVGVAAVLGHNYPVYLRFRGGKGVATTIGVALGIYPYFTVAIVIALLGYAAARFATGIVAVGSLTMAVVFPLAAWTYTRYCGLAVEQVWPLLVVSVLLGLMIVVRHRDNIRRLFAGTET